MSTLLPEDVPGAVLKVGISLEDHSVLELQRWLECRGLKKAGTKNELITRITNCINAGNANKLFLGIDGGKWYDAKNNIIQQPQGSNISTSFLPAGLIWGKFPSCSIPKYFNKGHIFTFIVGENVENDDPEVEEFATKTTVKPFKRGHQYVDSDHITEIWDAQMDNHYICQCKCLASFQIHIKYTVTVIINRISGAIIRGICECKQSALGKCSHVTALLIFINEYIAKYQNSISPTSLPREWGVGSKKHNPTEIKSATYPMKRFKPLQRGNFDPRPRDYDRTFDTNTFISKLQATEEDSGFLTVLHLSYEDFTYCGEEIYILKLQCKQYLKNIREFALKQESTLFVIPETEQGSEEWLRWRTFYITSTNAKLVATQLISDNAKQKFLLKNLWRMNKPITTKAMQYGKDNESRAREQFRSNLDKHLSLHETGLVVNSNYPFFATSVDGIVMEGGEGGRIHQLIEIKCPKMLEKCRNVEDFDTFLSKTQLQNCFLTKEDGHITIKKNHPYLYQILLSLIIFDVDICNLIVWTPRSTLVVPIKKQNYINAVESIKKNVPPEFYCNIYVPEMFTMRTVRNLHPIKLHIV